LFFFRQCAYICGGHLDIRTFAEMIRKDMRFLYNKYEKKITVREGDE